MSLKKITNESKLTFEPLPVFSLENNFFDQLSTANDIALYAMLRRLDSGGLGFTKNMLMDFLNLSQDELDDSIKKLTEIGFLKQSL